MIKPRKNTQAELPPELAPDYEFNHGLQTIAIGNLGVFDISTRDYSIDEHLHFPGYEIGDRHMIIRDTVWGEYELNAETSKFDELLIKLAKTPLFTRLQSIEQLTLGKDYATMPNTMAFSRWSHIWGSLVFVRKMNEGRGIDPREDAVMQLRTLLSDVGHTAFSHLGDWLFQGFEGSEDLHDQDLKDILEVSGISEILNEYGFSVEETVFPDVEDWVECPSPDLCVDRLDYGLREILKTFTDFIPLTQYSEQLKHPQKLFGITEDNKLYIKNERFARLFAAGYALLPTEHWAHPSHRLQLQLFQSAVRSVLVSELQYEQMHPREKLYGIDSDFAYGFQEFSLLQLHQVMQNLAKDQRRIFIQARKPDLQRVFGRVANDNWDYPEFPDPLRSYSWQSKEFIGPIPMNINFEVTTDSPNKVIFASDKGLQAYLPSLKPRAIDPLVMSDKNKICRLSKLPGNYSDFLEGQRNEMSKKYVGTIFMREDWANVIELKDVESRLAWEGLLRRNRSKKRLASAIEDSAFMVPARRFDSIREV